MKYRIIIILVLKFLGLPIQQTHANSLKELNVTLQKLSIKLEHLSKKINLLTPSKKTISEEITKALEILERTNLFHVSREYRHLGGEVYEPIDRDIVEDWKKTDTFTYKKDRYKYVDDNKISKAVTTALKYHKNLKKISLENLESNILPMIFKAVNANTKLQELKMFNCKIESLSQLNLPKTLKSLSIRTNYLGSTRTKYLTQTVIKNLKLPSSLTILDLSFNQLTDTELAVLTLPHNLEILNLGENDLTDDRLNKLPKSLRTIFLDGNKKLTIACIDTLKNLPLLEKLDLSSLTKFDNKFFSKLQLSTSLKSLTIAENNLTDINFGALKKLNLIHLDVSENNLNQKSIDSLAELTSLKNLNLRVNKLKNIDFSKLKSLQKLTSLNLEYNNLNDIDVSTIPALKKLEKLFLSVNPNIQGHTLKELKKLTSLKYLSIITRDLEVAPSEVLEDVEIEI